MSKQLDFFNEEEVLPRYPAEWLDYRAGIFTPAECSRLLSALAEKTSWTQPVRKMYDREVLTPRLTAWFADAGPQKRMAQKSINANTWTAELEWIRERVEPLAGFVCNSVLLNYYRDGNDSVAWHSDNESMPGTTTVVASVSFGQVRNFDIRRKQDHREKYAIPLEEGSFLLMKAGFQDGWEHRIARSSRAMKPRLNLTFRLTGGE